MPSGCPRDSRVFTQSCAHWRAKLLKEQYRLQYIRVSFSHLQIRHSSNFSKKFSQNQECNTGVYRRNTEGMFVHMARKTSSAEIFLLIKVWDIKESRLTTRAHNNPLNQDIRTSATTFFKWIVSTEWNINNKHANIACFDNYGSS